MFDSNYQNPKASKKPIRIGGEYGYGQTKNMKVSNVKEAFETPVKYNNAQKAGSYGSQKSAQKIQA